MSVSKPPLDLTAVGTTPDGTEYRWASHKAARDRPTGITFSTARWDGFKAAGCVLPRRIDQDSVDLHLLDNFALIGVDGSVAFDGRVHALPRSMDTAHSVAVQAVGFMAHAKDRKFPEIYVDRDLSHWGQPSINRLAQLTAGSPKYRMVDTGTVLPDQGSLLPAVVLSQTRIASTSTQRDISESWYDARGIPIGALYYDQIQFDGPAGGGAFGAGTDWNISATFAENDGDTGSRDSTGNLKGANSAAYLQATTATRLYAYLQLYFANATSSDGDWRSTWRKLAVYGNHGLTRHGSDPGGFYASDVIKNIVSRFCPKLNAAGVQDTSYPIPHLAFHDPVHPYDAFLACNAYHLWGLEVWEDRTLYYGPVDLTDYDWQVRLSDHGVSVDLQGDSTDDLANGIAVSFQDVNKGAQNRLTPDVYSELRDDAVENPANRAGLTIWTEITLSSPTTADAALQLGRVALAEFNAPKAPGTITVRGHIRDRAGHFQQVWKVRAGDRIAIVDHPNDRPRLISETSYGHDPPSVQISVEGMPKRLDAVLDRVGTALSAAGLA